MHTLYYVHDPMCSWCYAFVPVWERIQADLPADVGVEYVLGGLAPDTDQPMPVEMREHIRQTWRRIETAVPGTMFNFDFWARAIPRRATYPACRAVLAAKHFDPALERPMIAAIQRAYYREARNPADIDTLAALGEALGIEPRAFRQWLSSEDCEARLRAELLRARELGVMGFPSLVLGTSRGPLPIQHSYTDPSVTLRGLRAALAAIEPRSGASAAARPAPRYVD